MRSTSREPAAIERNAPTRVRILSAATALFWRDGYSGVGVEAICKAAGVQKGSFYHAFSSKESLVIEAIHTIWSANREQIKEIYRSKSSISEQFLHHMEWFGQSQRRLRAKFGFVPGTLEMALNIGVPPAIVEFNRRASEDHAEILLNAIANCLAHANLSVDSAPWLAAVVRRLIAGAHIEARIANSLEPFDALPETILALLGLGPRPLQVEPSLVCGVSASEAEARQKE